MNELPNCPVCGQHHFKTVGPRSLVMWHWKLNPGLCFNEVLLGQRVVETYHECLSCDAPLRERVFIHCRNCDRLFRQYFKPARAAFGNWYGLFCPQCGAEVPATRNYWTRLIMFLSRPLWHYPDRRWGGRWRAATREKQRRAISAAPPSDIPRPSYLKMGALFGGMFVLLYGSLSWLRLRNFMRTPADWGQWLGVLLGGGILAGALFGGWMRFHLERRRKRAAAAGRPGV